MGNLIASSAARRAVIFDGDDTLWCTERLYDYARDRARRIVSSTGLNGGEWEALERQIDVTNVKSMGYAATRFPTSCRQAYEEMCRRHQRMPSEAVGGEIEDAARSVFMEDPSLMPKAYEVLSLLRRHDVRLALLTKGDAAVQQRRVERSGLGGLFEVILIVPEKTSAVMREIVARLGVKRTDAWTVGNSVRSDILPGLEAGLRAIWIDAPVWEHERCLDRVVDERIISLGGLKDVPAAIGLDDGGSDPARLESGATI
jgi:putative hydrolase of the HAD superfamily